MAVKSFNAQHGKTLLSTSTSMACLLLVFRPCQISCCGTYVCILGYAKLILSHRAHIAGTFCQHSTSSKSPHVFFCLSESLYASHCVVGHFAQSAMMRSSWHSASDVPVPVRESTLNCVRVSNPSLFACLFASFEFPRRWCLMVEHRLLSSSPLSPPRMIRKGTDFGVPITIKNLVAPAPSLRDLRAPPPLLIPLLPPRACFA
jgi:hypothetical protein